VVFKQREKEKVLKKKCEEHGKQTPEIKYRVKCIRMRERDLFSFY